MKNVLSCILVFILIFSNNLFAENSSIGLNMNATWRKTPIDISYNFKIGKKAEMQFCVGYHYGVTNLSAIENHGYPVSYFTMGKQNPNILYNYFKNDIRANTQGIFFRLSQRFYFSKKIGLYSPDFRGAFYGNSITFFNVIDNYKIGYANAWGTDKFKTVYTDVGRQTFNVLRITSEGGYRFAIHHKMYFEAMMNFAFYIPLTKGYPPYEPFSLILPELTFGAGYYL
ncbi:MAG: hypothetical protein RJA07_193 [Bacteroidota bacterium]|jgi:hypothetical protein